MAKNIQFRLKRSLGNCTSKQRRKQTGMNMPAALAIQNIVFLLLICLIMIVHTAEGKWCTRLVANRPLGGQRQQQQQQQQQQQLLQQQQQQPADSDSDTESGVKHHAGSDDDRNTTTTTSHVIERECCAGYYFDGSDCRSRLSGCNDSIYGHGLCNCSKDYIYNATMLKCMPICDPTHAKSCALRKQCIESPGYRYVEASGECEPVCSSAKFNDGHFQCRRSCLTGQCFHARGHGAAILDYDAFVSNNAVNCSRECGYGECLAPFHCHCQQGYGPKRHSPQYCHPQCQHKCPVHSKCVQPNICECERGFRLDTLSRRPRCKPANSRLFAYAGSIPSAHKQMTANDIMEKIRRGIKCQPGYKFDDLAASCQPACHNDCFNGNCTAPDVCVCRPGYSLNVSSHMCQLNVCKTPCANGICLDNGECICPEGLTKSLIKGAGCEQFFAHTAKVLLVFLSIACIITGVIWLITLLERRMGNM